MDYTRKALATRGRILDSAVELMLRKGLSRTRLSEVLVSSRVQKGNFYYYFASKEEMGVAVIRERGLQLVDDWLADACQPGGDPWVNIQSIARKLGANSGVVDGSNNPVIVLMHDLSRVNGELRNAIGEALSEVSKRLAMEFRRLREAGRLGSSTDPGELAACLLSVIQGAMLLYQGSLDSQELQRIVELALDHIRSGVRSE